jgi:probable F420-dependent oxidoreductase
MCRRIPQSAIVDADHPHLLGASVDFGLALLFTAETLAPASVGRLAEDLGFESLFAADHSHIPASRETPYPNGGELPPEYSRNYDPFAVLASAATVTEKIKLGTCVCLVNERDPIITAKEVATVDHLSGGRFVLGIGGGWNREAMVNHGVNPKTRMRMLRDRVGAMKAIWTQDEASYESEFVSFERIWSWPKPVQRPHPPILLGNNVPAAIDRVIDYADGWLPAVYDDDERLAQVAELRAKADRHVPVTLLGVTTDPARLARYEEAGIDRVVFLLRPKPADAMTATIERLAAAAERFRSAPSDAAA